VLIRIEDFPSDRKIKHITFDVTFEEDGSYKSRTEQHVILPTAPVTKTTGVNESMPITSDVRSHKDIPPEMTDMEF
jgi:hypothetical protein